MSETSVLTDKELWTSENAGHLVQHYAENLELGAGGFLERLESQLARSPARTKQLAAEMLWVMYLFCSPQSMHAETKRRQIRQVWKWSEERLPRCPFELEEALEEGVGHPGIAFNTHRWRELLFFVLAMAAWTALSTPRREALLGDPWRFAKWLKEQDESGTRQLRHMMLYLLFPGHFEPLATGFQKRAIVREFARKHGEDLGHFDYSDRIAVDRRVLAVRKKLLARGAAKDFDFYDKPYLAVWQPGTATKGNGGGNPATPGAIEEWYRKEVGEARVWTLAPGEGARLWREFRQKGIIAIGWDDLGDMGKFDAKKDIHERLREILDQANPFNASLACYQFAHEMQPEDYVIAKTGAKTLLGYGIIQSGYEYDESRSEYRHTRRVAWKRIGNWDVAKPITTKTLTDYTRYKDWLLSAFALIRCGNGLRNGPEPYTEEQALEDLFLDPAEFKRIIDALHRKKNVVLEGPPGVGKTFIAKRLAYTVIGYKVPERVRMVQFHQSYAYEDFIQGYRPRDEGGFELRDGVFHTFCREAAGNPDDKYVFIIDEINRGNLSKIFGELMMLIEADKRSADYGVPLTYSPDGDPFHVPPNLYIIGMMNTADRSLAMVDYALRRRFAFVRLRPEFASEEFSNFLHRAGVESDVFDKLVERLTALNARIRDDRKNLGPGFEIGHSFFCPGEIDDELDQAWYEAVVRREIEPLLREYWFDRPDEVKRRVRELLA